MNDNFKDHGEDKAKASDKRNGRISLINQSIALYFWNALKDLEKLTITDKAEFKEVQHLLNTLQAKKSDSADLGKAAREFEKQARLAELQIAQSQKQRREGDEHSASIQSLPDKIGRATRLERLWAEGEVKQCSEQAEERARKLEKELAHVEKHRRETEAIIDVCISQARKRADAVTEARARENAVNGMFLGSERRAINDAIIRTTNATNRANANPIGRSTYTNIADLIITNNVNPAAFVTVAEREARAAGVRAKYAERRARIAKAYNDP